MKVCYFKENPLLWLKAGIEDNLEKYQNSPEPWVGDFFRDNYGISEWFLESRVECADIELELPADPDNPRERARSDLENTKRIYSALKHLTPVQASDERLWAYMTHVTFWDYMDKRWFYSKKKSEVKVSSLMTFVRRRYFFGDSRDRSLVRNGIARLWWFGYTTYDEKRENPFELTEVLLSKQDVAQQFLERNFSRNVCTVKNALQVVLELERRTNRELSREDFRKLMKHINRIGGIAVLDAFDKGQIERTVEEAMDLKFWGSEEINESEEEF